VVCIPAIPATCIIDGAAGAIGGAATGALGNGFADAMRDGATWVIETTVGWWINIPAVDLESSPASTIRGYVLWLAVAVATAGVIWQGILLTLSRKPDPVLNVGRGLFLVALWSAVGIIGPAAALRAGDAFSSWVLGEASGGHAADRLVALASLAPIESTGAVILLGLLMMLVGLVQAVLMMFREGAVVILSGVTVLAAAGSFTRATRPWLPRVVGWLLALICYKPAAALVYASALALVGEGQDPRTVVVGLAMMVLAIVALPALMRFFTWTAGSVEGGGVGGVAAMAGASAAAIHASAALGGSSGRSASTQADHIRQDLGPVAGSGSGVAPYATPVGASSSPAGAAPAGASAAGAGTAAGAAAGPVGVAVVAGTAAAGAANAAGRTATDTMTKEPPS
jgi:hypothetical protein